MRRARTNAGLPSALHVADPPPLLGRCAAVLCASLLVALSAVRPVLRWVLLSALSLLSRRALLVLCLLFVPSSAPRGSLDIAFFYLAMAVVAMAVLPWSLVKLGFWIHESLQSPQLIPLTRIQKLKLQQTNAAKANGAAAGAAVVGETVNVQPAGASSSSSSSSSALLDPVTAQKSAAAASGLTQENLRPSKPWLSCGNITLALLWVLFLYMLLQIPSFQSENLASFKPYEILGLPTEGGKSTATDEEIKRAYRKQSLVYHPDRNPSPEAAQQFMLIAKAYETLTSPTAKANIEKYGNPDGYQVRTHNHGSCASRVKTPRFARDAPPPDMACKRFAQLAIPHLLGCGRSS